MAASRESVSQTYGKSNKARFRDDSSRKKAWHRGHEKKQETMKQYRKKQTKGLTEKAEIEQLLESCKTFDSTGVSTFKDFPLSTKTQLGLEESGYSIPTEIQKESIGLSLKGLDILGAAKTGSGKTLAFVVPLLEKLYKEMWSRYYGLGALIITPTRELAYQIFEVLKKVGVHHDFSAGLIIGGKDLKFESKRMDSCNIVVCTPGRLLQHMDENPLFDATQLQILVLDEADRILDLGFQQTVNAIIENLPLERQTLLFSATQTKSVKDLARLSLKNPMYVSVHEHAKFTTPEGLLQSYVVCELYNKLNLLWSFIRNHLKQKILVFVSSCKQVKYMYQAFCRMRPGTTLMALHGNMHQMKRMAMYVQFCRKQNAVLIATDVAARGLDFPSVNWVIQLDCPEDVSTYIHRAGRTARLEKDGEALLVLLPSEESMVKQLAERKIPIQKIDVNPRKLMSVQRKMEVLCARDVQLKESAQRCFTAYLKNVFLMKDKTIFDVKKLDLELFARSLGLALAPRVRFLQKHLKQLEQQKQKVKVAAPKPSVVVGNESEEEEENEGDLKPVMKQADAFRGHSDSDASDDDIFTVKQRITYDAEGNEEVLDQPNRDAKRKKPITKAALAKKVLNKRILPNKKVVFDEEGEAVREGPNMQKAEVISKLLKEEKAPCGIDVEISKKIMQEEDKFDKQRDRERVKAMHKAARRKLKEERRAQQGGLASLSRGTGNDEASEEEEESEMSEAEEEDSSAIGSGTGSEGESGGSSADLSEEEAQVARPSKKRAAQSSKRCALSKRQKLGGQSSEEEDGDIAPMNTGLDLEGDEALALQMLSR